MPPVEDISKIPRFPSLKQRYRVSGDGPLGVGRCSYSLYKDYLINPTNVQSVNIDNFVDGSVSTLLEHCLGWKREQKDDPSKIISDVSSLTCPFLRYLATCDHPKTDDVAHLCSQYGCDVSSARGQGPLHVLLTSHVSSVSLSLVSQLVEAGVKLDQRDEGGNTPLLCLSSLLERGQMSLAAQIAQFLCTQSDCDVNSVNIQGRSLLSLSVSYLDDSIELTRVLINHGARVWPHPGLAHPVSVDDVTRDNEESAFTWFLRAVISQRGLNNSERTVECLCHVMGREPERMKSHVTRVMISEGRHPRVLGPVFLQLKMTMAPFWTRPQHLTYLAWNSVRTSLGPKRLGRVETPGHNDLGLPLPTPIIKYLTLAGPGYSYKRQKLK